MGGSIPPEPKPKLHVELLRPVPTTMEMEPEDGCDDGILVANGYRAPFGTNWKYTACELDENILYNLNGIAGLRV